MKTLLSALAVSVLGSVPSLAQVSALARVEPAHNVRQIKSTPVDGHTTLHERVFAESGLGGEPLVVTNRYVELATGLNHWQVDAWIPSEGVLNVENGEAVGLRGQHKVWLPGEMGGGGYIRLQLPTGELLQSAVFGIGYYDPTTGQSVLLAEAKPATGVLYPPNQIVYENAFDTLKASLRYTYTVAGFEQDLILGEIPPEPEVFGLSEKSRLEVWTEFVEAPEPQIEARILNEEAVASLGELALSDQRLTFGSMHMDEGRAFPESASDHTLALVSKEWVQTPEQRRFLVEAVAVQDLQAGLKELPRSREGASLRRRFQGRLVAGTSDRPRIRTDGKPTREIEIASTARPETPGVVVDYLLNGSAANVTFASGTTYYVTGLFNATGTLTTFEPGVIFKYKKGVGARINVTTPVSWLASAYRPVVFTAEHDNTIGAEVATGTLTGYYADPALELTTATSFDIKHLRITHAKTGLKLSGSGTPIATLWHAQFVNSETGILINKVATVRPRNVLFHNVVWILDGTSATAPIQAEHITVNTATLFNKGGFSSVTVANSILAGVATLPPASYTATSASVVTPSSPATVFQVSGAGHNYLPTTSAYRNAGIPGINTQLKTELASMTTEAPTVYSGSLTTWNQKVARDFDTLDYGYHYQPIDYAFDNVVINNATLNISPGVAVAKIGTNNLGVRLTGTANLCAKGTPTSPIHFARYNAIQEQPVDWNGTPEPTLAEVMISPGTTGAVGLRFCSFHLIPQRREQHSVYVNETPANVGSLLLRDCDLFLGNHWFIGTTTGSVPEIQLINNIFDSADVEFFGRMVVEARNNLFRRGTLMWFPGSTTSWGFQDNLIDSVFLLYNINELGFLRSHNAYYNIQESAPPLNATEIQLGTLSYASASYGALTQRYYIGNNTSLVDKGSRPADQARLRYYTTQAAQASEQMSLVDIGPHYVALNVSGAPADSNGNLTADYLEEQSTSCTCEYNSCSDLPVAVALTSPLNGQLFLTSPTNIIVSASAMDPDGVIQDVKFYINGILSSTDTTAPYLYYWDNVQAGVYTVYARATPASGTPVNTPTATVTVYDSPTIDITKPALAHSILPPSSDVTFEMVATAPNSTITKVELFSGVSTLVGQATKIGNIYQLLVTDLVDGRHYFYARVTDQLGRFRDSKPVTIQVIAPAAFPTTIAITSPSPNTQIVEGTPVMVKASVSASPAIARVEFYADNDLIATDSQAPYATTFSPKAGTHALVAKAYTSVVPVKSARSAPVSLSVNVPELASGSGFWETYGIGAGVLPSGESQNDAFYDLILGEDGTLIGSHEEYTSAAPKDFLLVKPGESAWFAPDGRVQGGPLTEPSSAITGLRYDGVFYATAPTGLYYWTSSTWQQILATTGTYPPVNPPTMQVTHAYLSDAVLALTPWRGDLIAGGAIPAFQNIARISTVTKSASSLNVTLNGRVRALLVLNDTLYVGGEFTSASTAGGAISGTAYLAKFDGTTWSAVPQSGLNGAVWALAEWQGRLVVGGRFTSAGGNATANRLAMWDGTSWSTVGMGVSGQPDPDPVAPPVVVMSLASRGQNLYVGGRFNTCTDYGGNGTLVNNVAEAIWDTVTQRWNWRAMDGGVTVGSIDWVPHGPSNVGVHALVVQEGQSGAYDIVAAGCFERAGSLLAANIARWRVGAGSGLGSSPLVTILTPSSGFVTTPGQSISVTGVVFTSGQTDHSISTVSLYRRKDDGAPELITTDAPWLVGSTYNFTFDLAITASDIGRQELWVLARQVDETGQKFSEATSSKCIGVVKAPSTTLPSSDDFFSKVNSGRTERLDVLANDQQPTTRRITGVQRYAGVPGFGGQPAALGVVRPTADGKALEYFPRAGAFGQDIFYYESMSGTSVSVAAVIIDLKVPPLVNIVSPVDDFATPLTAVTVVGNTQRRNAAIVSLKCYRDQTLVGTAPDPSIPEFSFTVGSLTAFRPYHISVVATDNQEPPLSTTQRVTVFKVRPQGADTAPVARLIAPANPLIPMSTVQAANYPIIRDGMMSVVGDAYDPNNTVSAPTTDLMSYSLQLYPPGGSDEPIANLTPGTLDADGFQALAGNVVNGSLGSINLSRVPNGVYDLWLIVRGGPLSAVDVVRVAVDCDLKLGRLTFSEEDTLIPVNGIPLSLVRTYDSFDPNSGDFGPGWRYSLMDIDAKFDEEREDKTPFLDLQSTGADAYTLPPINVRSGGGYNMTLTLPGGDRTTFVFNPRRSATTQLLYAEWNTAAGVDATLRIHPEDGVHNTINFFANGLGEPVWNGGDVHIPFERYDIPVMLLTTADGTEYYLERTPSEIQAPHYVIEQTTGKYAPVQPRPGPFRLAKILQPTGDAIVITPNSPGVDGEVAHFPANAAPNASPTRKLTFKRDDLNRIVEVRDPATIEAGSSVAIIKYTYDPTTGNLIQVHRLIDRAAGTYATTTYDYNHPRFPNYITAIVDPRGIQVARTDFDDSGRLNSVVDSTGRSTTYTYPTSGFGDARSKARVETRDHDQNQQITESDQFGNVVYSVNRDPGGLQIDAIRKFYYDIFGIPTRLTQEQVAVRDPANSSLTLFNLLRDYGYTDNDNPMSPTSVIDWHVQATPGNLLRRRNLTYDDFGQLTQQVDPLYSSGTVVHTDTTYDSVTHQPLIQSFTGTAPLGNAVTLSQNIYFPLGDLAGRAGRLNYSLDANNSATIYEYATTTVPGSYRVGDLVSITLRENGVNGGFLSKSSYTYDANGNVLTEIQRNSANTELRRTTYEYDSQNRRVKTIDAAGGVAEQKFNRAGQVAKTVDRYGNSIYTFYDRLNSPSCVRNPDGSYSFTIHSYNSVAPYGRVMVRTDRAFPSSSSGIWSGLNGTRTFFDVLGRLTRTERLTGITLLESTTGAIHASLPDLDLICDVSISASQVSTDFRTLKSEYYDDGRLWRETEVLDPNQSSDDRVTSYTYSSDGLSRTTRLPSYVEAGQTVSTEITETYDLNGNIVASQTKGTRGSSIIKPQSRYNYDQLNRQIETRLHVDETDAVGVRVSLSEFDWSGRRIRETDADGNQTKFDYDGAGRLKQVTAAETSPEAVITKFGYDALGQLVTQIDANQSGATTPASTSFLYDGLGRRTRRTLPGGQYEEWTHDYDEATGTSSNAQTKPNKVRHRDFSALTAGEVLFTYDMMGRLDLKRKKSGSTWVTMADFDYTSTGQRSRMQDNLDSSGPRTTKYVYDALDRLKVKHAPEGSLTYNYLVGGELGSISARLTYTFPANPPYSLANIGAGSTSNPDGAFMAYEYDARGRLWKVNSTDVTYAYDSIGRKSSVTYVNNLQSSYTYNARSQVTRLQTTSPAPNSASDFKYDDPGWGARRLANSGLRRRLVETVGATVVNRTIDYDYDALNRLRVESIQTVAPHGTITYDAQSGYNNDPAGFGFDKVGNRRSRTVVSGSSPSLTASGVVDYASQDFDSRDRLILSDNSSRPDPVQDANGNTTTSGSMGFTYDLENRLTRRTGGAEIRVVYDGDGHRVRKEIGPVGSALLTYYVVDDRNPTGYAQVLEERASLTGAPTVSYIYGLDLVSQKRGSVISYYGYDGLGSVRYLTSSTGAITDTYTYDAFGIQIASTPSSNPTPNQYRYTGEQWDSDLGMYYLRARYYHPDFGRFWTMDTFEGNQNDPLSLHKYLYASSNPVNLVDPSGQTAITMDFMFAPSLAMDVRSSFERNRAPIYKGAILAALTVAGTYAATALTEAIQIHDAEMTLAGAGTSVRDEIAKAAQILRTRVGNITPKIVPIPMSVIPDVAQNVAVGQLTTPGPLTRVNLLTTVMNRYAATSGKGSAGPGMSWDEYPFASSLQGGRPAVVRPVPKQQNWVQGGIIAAAYAIQKINIGDSYTVVITP